MNAWRKHFWMAPMAAAVFLLAGCSQPAPKVNDDAEAKKEPAGPAESVTAKTALWPMYTSARNWTKDFVVLRLASKEVPGFKNDAGKAAMWEATFASPGQHEYRVYTNSIAAHPPDIYKGVSIGRAIPWAGVTRDVMPVQLSEFNVDSDAAYATATADAGAWLKKNPGKPLSKFELGNAFRFQAPVWYFMWGDKKLGYTAFVNATTGKIVKAK